MVPPPVPVPFVKERGPNRRPLHKHPQPSIGSKAGGCDLRLETLAEANRLVALPGRPSAGSPLLFPIGELQAETQQASASCQGAPKQPAGRPLPSKIARPAMAPSVGAPRLSHKKVLPDWPVLSTNQETCHFGKRLQKRAPWPLYGAVRCAEAALVARACLHRGA